MDKSSVDTINTKLQLKKLSFRQHKTFANKSSKKFSIIILILDTHKTSTKPAAVFGTGIVIELLLKVKFCIELLV